mgnify:CR=1 FL=1
MLVHGVSAFVWVSLGLIMRFITCICMCQGVCISLRVSLCQLSVLVCMSVLSWYVCMCQGACQSSYVHLWLWPFGKVYVLCVFVCVTVCVRGVLCQCVCIFIRLYVLCALCEVLFGVSMCQWVCVRIWQGVCLVSGCGCSFVLVNVNHCNSDMSMLVG